MCTVFSMNVVYSLFPLYFDIEGHGIRVETLNSTGAMMMN